METLQLLMDGFARALQPANLMFAFIGCVLGTLVGVLPGIGPAVGTAMLIPLTFRMDPASSIVMLAAIYYGAMYGGTLTSVLVNMPGEAASAITCLDGHEMAKQGRAGPALAVAAIGSFFGGTIATMGLVVVARPLAAVALKFGPPEFFALMVCGLSLVTGLAGKSLVRALVSAILGLLIASVGIDPIAGAPRFVFGVTGLLNGIDIVPVAMGLFGIAEILLHIESGKREVFQTNLRSLLPAKNDVRDSALPMLRGAGIGFFLGLIPGVGAVVPTIMSYIAEKRLSKTPHRFGTGMIQGVAGPETANNAYSNAALIPLFTLGLPGSPTVAILMGAFMMNGLIPGPFLFRDHSDIVWTVIASLYIGNAILLILNLPLIPLWLYILKIPYAILAALILGFSALGAYTLNGSVFDVAVMLIFGVIGYLMKKLDIPAVPILLTMVLGPLMEQALSQSLDMSGGRFSVLVTRPIPASLLALSGVFVYLSTRQAASLVKGEDSEL